MSSLTTFTGWADTIMNNQWGYFFNYANANTWTDSTPATVYIGVTDFLGYAGAMFAFLASLIGALETIG